MGWGARDVSREVGECGLEEEETRDVERKRQSEGDERATDFEWGTDNGVISGLSTMADRLTAAAGEAGTYDLFCRVSRRCRTDVANAHADDSEGPNRGEQGTEHGLDGRTGVASRMRQATCLGRQHRQATRDVIATLVQRRTPVKQEKQDAPSRNAQSSLPSDRHHPTIKPSGQSPFLTISSPPLASAWRLALHTLHTHLRYPLMLAMANDYFPPTPPHDETDTMDSQKLNMAQLAPNGAAPPPGAPTGTKEAPNRMALKLSHLPSRQKIKPVYPRSPSTVRRSFHVVPVLPLCAALGETHICAGHAH